MKEIYLEKINKYFKNNKIKKIFKEQLELFYRISEMNIEKKYNIGDEVILNKNYLIHGTRTKINDINNISKHGLVAVEFHDKQYPNQKKPYTCEFWYIKNTIKLKDYINKYTGGTIIFKRKEGNIETITNIDNIEYTIKNMKEDYANWEVYQTKEARFLPVNNKITLAFIINAQNEASKLLDNSIQSDKLDKKIKKKILPKWFYKKYIEKNVYDVFETQREIAILLGIPSNLIEGIIVNKNIENSIKDLETIKNIFPKCYICNIEGKVIY